LFRHSRESGNPANFLPAGNQSGISASAEMTGKEV
jgi:hypothetical protein